MAAANAGCCSNAAAAAAAGPGSGGGGGGGGGGWRRTGAAGVPAGWLGRRRRDRRVEARGRPGGGARQGGMNPQLWGKEKGCWRRQKLLATPNPSTHTHTHHQAAWRRLPPPRPHSAPTRRPSATRPPPTRRLGGAGASRPQRRRRWRLGTGAMRCGCGGKGREKSGWSVFQFAVPRRFLLSDSPPPPSRQCHDRPPHACAPERRDGRRDTPTPPPINHSPGCRSSRRRRRRARPRPRTARRRAGPPRPRWRWACFVQVPRCAVRESAWPQARGGAFERAVALNCGRHLMRGGGEASPAVPLPPRTRRP